MFQRPLRSFLDPESLSCFLSLLFSLSLGLGRLGNVCSRFRPRRRPCPWLGRCPARFFAAFLFLLSLTFVESCAIAHSALGAGCFVLAALRPGQPCAGLSLFAPPSSSPVEAPSPAFHVCFFLLSPFLVSFPVHSRIPLL